MSHESTEYHKYANVAPENAMQLIAQDIKGNPSGEQIMDDLECIGRILGSDPIESRYPDALQKSSIQSHYDEAIRFLAVKTDWGYACSQKIAETISRLGLHVQNSSYIRNLSAGIARVVRDVHIFNATENADFDLKQWEPVTKALDTIDLPNRPSKQWESFSHAISTDIILTNLTLHTDIRRSVARMYRTTEGKQALLMLARGVYLYDAFAGRDETPEAWFTRVLEPETLEQYKTKLNTDDQRIYEDIFHRTELLFNPLIWLAGDQDAVSPDLIRILDLFTDAHHISPLRKTIRQYGPDSDELFSISLKKQLRKSYDRFTFSPDDFPNKSISALALKDWSSIGRDLLKNQNVDVNDYLDIYLAISQAHPDSLRQSRHAEIKNIMFHPDRINAFLRDNTPKTHFRVIDVNKEPRITRSNIGDIEAALEDIEDTITVYQTLETHLQGMHPDMLQAYYHLLFLDIKTDNAQDAKTTAVNTRILTIRERAFRAVLPYLFNTAGIMTDISPIRSRIYSANDVLYRILRETPASDASFDILCDFLMSEQPYTATPDMRPNAQSIATPDDNLLNHIGHTGQDVMPEQYGAYMEIFAQRMDAILSVLTRIEDDSLYKNTDPIKAQKIQNTIRTILQKQYVINFMDHENFPIEWNNLNWAKSMLQTMHLSYIKTPTSVQA